MKEHIKRVDRILKYKGSILDIYTDVIETPDGHRAEWDYIDHRGAAAVVPVLDDGRLLMVRQYRDALDRETIEIPAGGLNGWDEPTINAAARELEEETGYRSDNLTKLVSVVTAVAFCNEVVDVYLATGLVKTSQHLDEDEFIDVEKYTLDELKDMIFAGTIQVFIPSLGAFFISDVMGGGSAAYLGNLIQNQFLVARNWPLGAAFSVLLIIFTLVVLKAYSKVGDLDDLA